VSSPGLDIDINAAVGVQPEAPAPTTAALGQQTDLVLANGPQALVCKALLSHDAEAKATVYARQVWQTLAANPAELAKFGSEAVDGVNSLASRMLHEAGRAANIPELTQLTDELDDKLRGFTGKYDRSDKVKESRESYEKMKGKVLDFFNQYRDMLHMLLKDAKGIEAFLDSLSAQIIDKQGQLTLNVEMCNQLLAENEKAISNLTGVIAIMEIVRDEAAAAMNAIVIDDSSPDARVKREQRDQIAEFIQQLDVRIGEFKQRLYVAWATSPQVRNIRTISSGLAQRLGLLNLLTIPVFKLTVVQWVAVMQADQAAELGESVAATNEDALAAFAKASGEIIPRVAKAIQTPSMSPESVLLIAQSLNEQSKGIAEAYRFGIVERQKVEAAIMKGEQSMAASKDEQAAVVSELIAGTQNPLQLPAAPALPDVVTQAASGVLANPTPAAAVPVA
jgi:uncharacterized protein YaaN involved in tellurite resistance